MFGEVKVCPMQDAACAEIPEAARCRDCSSILRFAPSAPTRATEDAAQPTDTPQLVLCPACFAECNPAQMSEVERDAARYRFWRKHYSTRFAIGLRPGAESFAVFKPSRPAVEAFGSNYETKIDAALDAAMTATSQESGNAD